MHVSNDGKGEGDNDYFVESSGDEDESRPTGVKREQLYEEFVSMMEQRFLDGKDTQFFDYSVLNGDEAQKADKIREQDMEDEYFDSEEPD